MGLTVRTRIGFFLVVSILDVFRERLKMTGRKRRDILQRKREHRKVSRGLPQLFTGSGARVPACSSGVGQEAELVRRCCVSSATNLVITQLHHAFLLDV